MPLVNLKRLKKVERMNIQLLVEFQRIVLLKKYVEKRRAVPFDCDASIFDNFYGNIIPTQRFMDAPANGCSSEVKTKKQKYRLFMKKTVIYA